MTVTDRQQFNYHFVLGCYRCQLLPLPTITVADNNCLYQHLPNPTFTVTKNDRYRYRPTAPQLPLRST